MVQPAFIDILLKWNDKEHRFEKFLASEFMTEKETEELIKMAVKKINDSQLKKGLWARIRRSKSPGPVITPDDISKLTIRVLEPNNDVSRNLHTLEITFPVNDEKSEQLFNEFTSFVLKMHVLKSYYTN